MMWWLLALWACGGWRGGGGTAVGNPGKASVRLAPPAEEGWDVAGADRVEVEFESCDGQRLTRARNDIDLLEGPSFTIPPGQYCRLELRLEGLVASGPEALERDAATLVLELGGLRFDRASWVLELGEPGLPETIEDRSGLFEELVPDGQIDPIERSQGPRRAGEARTPDPSEPAALLVVGDDGLRATVTGLDLPDYITFDPTVVWFAAAHRDGRWVAVGGDDPGRVAWSDDLGLTWEATDAPAFFPAITTFDGSFYAPSPGIGLLSSADGEDWDIDYGGDEIWRDIAASPTRLVAVADGVVATSDDGTTWATQTLVGDPTFWAVAWGPSGFVAVGEGGERWFSADGDTWQAADTGGTKLYTVAWSGERYVAAGDGDTWRSTDGLTWEAGPEKPLEDVLLHDGDLFSVVGEGLYRSVDHGATWDLWRNLDEGQGIGLATNRPF